MIPITDYNGADVVVLGLDPPGLAAARALVTGGARVRAWDDSAVRRARAVALGVPVEDLARVDWRVISALVMTSDGTRSDSRPHRVVELALAAGAPIVSDVELYARAVNARAPGARPKTIAVTGEGAPIAAALIGHILQQCGKDAHVSGAAGVLDLAPLHAGAIYVLALSAGQLQFVDTLRCEAAICLSLGAGADAEEIAMRAFDNQGAGDWAIVAIDTPGTAAMCTRLMRANARVVAPISNGRALGRGVSVLGGALYDALDGRAARLLDFRQAPALAGVGDPPLAAAAYAAARALNLAPRAIAEAMVCFAGAAHRRQEIGAVGGVRFINDSAAVDMAAAAAALQSHQRVRWIAGGVAMGDDPLDRAARQFAHVAKAYLIGEAGPGFAASLERVGVPAQVCETVENAVAAAFADARAAHDAEIVLFSPGCAAFDQFPDYEARGAAFEASARALGSTAPAQIAEARRA